VIIHSKLAVEVTVPPLFLQALEDELVTIVEVQLVDVVTQEVLHLVETML